VPLEPGTGIDSIGDIEACVEEHCEQSGKTPCTGVNDRAVELCLENWDWHPGLLVPFRNDVQGIFQRRLSTRRGDDRRRGIAR
jgi:hypothetical protein